MIIINVNSSVIIVFWMMNRRIVRSGLQEKENDQKMLNKKKEESEAKMERVLLGKSNNHQDLLEIKVMRNSKDVRLAARSITEKKNKANEVDVRQELSNTQMYCSTYGDSVIKHEQLSQFTFGTFLHGHDIDKTLRARMLDWIIEVTSSYKFTPKTFFSSVYLMDRYFQKEQQRLPITKLHIVGATSMLIASKMDEVYPLKVKTVYQKIVHKKIQKCDLIEMQARMVDTLQFVLNNWSFYDQAVLKLHENWKVVGKEMIKEVELLCETIGKFVVFNYQLYGHYELGTMAAAVLRASFTIIGNLSPLNDNQPTKDSLVCMDLIFQTVKTFKSTFRKLSNIHKYSDASTLQRIEQFLKTY